MGHGLRFSDDLSAWRRWQESRHRTRSLARRARHTVRRTAPSQVDVLTPGADSDVLVAVEATHASVHRAVVAPLAHLDAASTSVVCPPGWVAPMEFASHQRTTLPVDEIARILTPDVVLAAGHYTEIGAAAHHLAEQRAVPFLVAQHGALTPYAPPLPAGAHLLAWSEEDIDFWRSGRTDVIATVVGSHLLWQAGRQPTTVSEGPPTYLGQGHAAEIPRSRMVEAALRFCREHDAVYRPHPSETDRLSLLTLAGFERTGVTVDTTPTPLGELTTPVVSVFSTGVLEAAARGRNAWVDFPRPPAWLEEFWERYAMSRYGHAPTPAPAQPDIEPARRVAEIVMESVR